MKKNIRILFFHLPLFSFSQQSNIDSLSSLLKTDKEDTNKVIHLNKLSWQYISISSYDSALLYASQTLALANSIPNGVGRGWASSSNNAIGVVYFQQGNYPKALDYYLKSLKIDEEINDKSGMADILVNIGIFYKDQGDYPKALDYYFKALKMDEELLEQAQHRRDAHEIRKEEKGIAADLSNIGLTYYEQKDYSKTLDCYFKALKIDEELGNKNGMAIRLGNIGLVYDAQKNYTKALDYYSKALKMREELGDKSLIAITLSNIGSLYTVQNKYGDAYNYLYHALALDVSNGEKDGVKDDYEQLSKLYEKSNAPLPDTVGGKILNKEKMRLRSMYYYKRSIAIRDTIFSEENKKQLVRKEMNYEFDKKEAATKAEQDKKDTITAEEKRRQKIITYSVSGGLFLVLLLALFIFRGYRQKQKANTIITQQKEEVEKQKKLVEEKNKDITDSINYAKRIQEAFLIPESEIKKQFSDAFVLFNPKDIVSGDIYWFAESKYNKVLVVADCTGHGVPGGFMSMLSFAMLQETLLLEEVKTTAQALTYLDHKITETLNRNNRSYRDGMDMTLCAFSKSANTLQFSCANRPLILIRNGKLQEFFPDKFTIGGAIDNVSKNFRNQEIQIEQDDMIYLFTDGYVDQFGGPKGKKFKHKQLNEKLLAISHLPLARQKVELEKTFVEWKGKLEQVDDVLLIGIKI